LLLTCPLSDTKGSRNFDSMSLTMEYTSLTCPKARY
jgi:hypothetical protein